MNPFCPDCGELKSICACEEMRMIEESALYWDYEVDDDDDEVTTETLLRGWYDDDEDDTL